jgi:hypothetical protein
MSVAPLHEAIPEMDIGKPRRTHTIEPLEDPVPREVPFEPPQEEPAEKPERTPEEVPTK